MKLNHDVCYEAIKTNDARFDGVFFVAVKTTGIYCRSVCKVPAPKSENCTFFNSAAESEANGFRPCLRCRPELAPQYSEFDQGKELVKLIVEYFELHEYGQKLIARCAAELGISPRHLNRVFKNGLGVSPKEYIMTKRLLRAKSLLTDTNLSITQIATTCGFGSPSRFHDALKKRYQLTASDIRKEYKSKNKLDSIKIKLYFRPPYDWESMLNFFRLRAIPGIEFITDTGIYRRSLNIHHNGQNHVGWIEIKPKINNNHFEVKLSRSLGPVMLQVSYLVKKALDLGAIPDQLPTEFPKGIRLPGCFDGFEMSVRAILGQQITVKAATTISGRVVDALGKEVETPWPEINYIFPEPKDILRLGEKAFDVLGESGVIRTRSASIIEIANGIETGNIVFTGSPEELKRSLLAIKGIGDWTAEYLSMRGLSWPDAFPVTDIVIKNRLLALLKSDSGQYINEIEDLSPYKLNKLYILKAEQYAEKYRPWRSYLTLALWRDAIKEDHDDMC